MKLYPKLALTILILILLQASFTGIFVSRTVTNNNLSDARMELGFKADFIINNYQSWKRHLWKQLIQIRDYSLRNGIQEMKDEDLSALLTSSSIDAVILKREESIYFMSAINSSPDFILPPGGALKVLYTHPYISLYQLKGQCYMIGTISLKSQSQETDVFLIKHINDSFLKNIVVDSDGRVLIHTGTDYLAGNKEIQNLAFRNAEFHPGKAYQEWYGVEEGDKSYNMASSKVGILNQPGNSSSVYLTAVLSDEPYRRRILSVERTVLTVSVFTLLITVLLSLIFTKGITRPVALLASAMGHIREGTYDIQLNIEDKGEMGVLLRGFNLMAARLNQDQLKIEKSLDEITFLNEFNEEVIHSIRDALAVVNDDLIIEKANPAFDQLSPSRTRSLTEFVREDFDSSLLDGVREVLSRKSEYWSQRIRNRQSRVFEVKIYPIHREIHIHSKKKMCVLIMEDISARNAYEERIFQAEKLSSISILSAGVAHEVNNPLSSILTNLQNLIHDEKNTDKLESLTLIEEETRRIAQIIRDLMNFTSREHESENKCSPTETAEEVRRLIGHSRRSDGSIIPPINISSAPGIPQVRISHGELMQILINLLQNAIHATDGDNPIEIHIGASKGIVSISVNDRGCGIPEESLNRVFDPFYTTKPNGEGTGLGLSVVYGIILKYKGNIHIESKVGYGTVITVSLPAQGSGS